MIQDQYEAHSDMTGPASGRTGPTSGRTGPGVKFTIFGGFWGVLEVFGGCKHYNISEFMYI